MALTNIDGSLKIQNRALQKLATGKSITEIFDELTIGAEEIVEDTYASILLLDNSGSRLLDGSTPSFPQSIKKAFHGMAIGPLEGSCGSAAYSKQLVIVEDISTDPRWEKFKDFAQSHGLKSCFSAPILGSDGSVLGTFALTFTKAKPPSDTVLEIIQSSAYIASLTIERKRYEENLQLYAKDLEEFSSIASHDLQEPLRKIVTFGELLESTIPVSDDQSRNYLQRIQSSATRMKNLIDDLLQFTEIGSKEHSIEQTDLNKVVEGVLEDLETRIRKTHGRVIVNNMPVIEADPVQMHQLFLNLIGNALKYHREGVPPVITLDHLCEGNGKCIIIVEDNGIGVEEKYFDQIFKPFKRLHGRTSYEGTGIGLSICEKIVSRHGGTITANSHSTDGVAFHISLPEKQY
jgi:signal transduction histidine kinase